MDFLQAERDRLPKASEIEMISSRRPSILEQTSVGMRNDELLATESLFDN